MQITFRCPQCEHKHAVGEELSGRRLACTGCQRELVVPGLSGIVPPPAVRRSPPDAVTSVPPTPSALPATSLDDLTPLDELDEFPETLPTPQPLTQPVQPVATKFDPAGYSFEPDPMAAHSMPMNPVTPTNHSNSTPGNSPPTPVSGNGYGYAGVQPSPPRIAGAGNMSGAPLAPAPQQSNQGGFNPAGGFRTAPAPPGPPPPQPKRKRKKKKNNSSGSEYETSTFEHAMILCLMVGTGIGLIVLVWIFVSISAAAAISAAFRIFFWAVTLGGGAWCVRTAFEDNRQDGFLCMFVPFYVMVYSIKRWDTMRAPFMVLMTGILGSLAILFMQFCIFAYALKNGSVEELRSFGATSSLAPERDSMPMRISPVKQATL